MAEQYADIIIDISHEKVDRVFQYRIPEALAGEVTVGAQVDIPFGQGNSLRKGYVVGLTGTLSYPAEKLKEISAVRKEAVSVQSQLIKLAWWMKEQYGSTMNQALKTVLPVKQKVAGRREKTLICHLSRDELARALEEAEKKSFKARARLFAALKESGEIPWAVAKNQLNISEATVKPLIERGILSLEERRKTPPGGENAPSGPRVTLNGEQQAAVRGIVRDLDSGRPAVSLIHGITGSGKTEVYMEIIGHVLAQGKQVILLIPEIALTYQTVMRFYRRFGDRISIMNSRLSAGERYEQWQKAAAGEVDILIGPRSALFAPFPRLGLIIIDEEHEGAYKSETMPRYHAREVAGERARMEGAGLVLGSATPSMEAYAMAEAGIYRLYRLTKRAVEDARLSRVHVVDLREELRNGNKSMFSGRLTELVEERLRKKEQIMLFINRRGYSNFMSCRSCGEAIRCPHCDVSLTYHSAGRRAGDGGVLTCHYCGHTEPVPNKCPHCGSPYIAGFGGGTQRLEEMTRLAFPGARVLRMDADTTSSKNGHQEILESFGRGEADILIGTQMIVKGHDFARVTLVGIMAADLSLNTPDFRCSERTFQLLTQAAGRAGRGSRAGDVVIQTYHPEHYSIRAAAAQDYGMFFRQEMEFRRVMNYPPACRMLTVQFASPKEEEADRAAKAAAERIADAAREAKAQVLGPVNASVYKVNDIYRKILYIKHTNYDILIRMKNDMEEYAAQTEPSKGLLVQYDFS